MRLAPRSEAYGLAKAILLGTFVGALAPAGQALADDGNWHVSGKAYLWLSDTSVATTQGQEVEAEFEDVIDSLELAFMGSLAARKDRWSWFGDILFVAVDARDTIPVTGPGIPIAVDADVKYEQDVWVFTVGGGYTIAESESYRLDVAAGARYLELDTDIGVDLGIGSAINLVDSSNVLDAVAAVKGYTDLGDRWYMSYYADIGTGDSDLTWQVLVDFNYEFSSIDVGVGYRILEWQSDSKGLIDDLRLSGPYVGLAFNFN
jgi:hypothetical protein